MKISVEVWRMRSEPGLIHLASSDGKTFHAEVTNVEGRIGYYPYLYVKLEGMLEAAGEAPAPPKTPGWLPRVMRGQDAHHVFVLRPNRGSRREDNRRTRRLHLRRVRRLVQRDLRVGREPPGLAVAGRRAGG